MPQLFNAAAEDLKSFLESLSPEEIQDQVDSATFFKGKQYYEWGLVDEVQYSFDLSRLTASVSGSLEYRVNLELQDGGVNAFCSCPVEGMCKHITAVLLFAMHENPEVGENRAVGGAVYQHLQKLSKEELIEMLLQWAPDALMRQIRNRHASAPEAQAAYRKAEAAIMRLFGNTELLYSPAEFSEALEKQLNSLLGLEHQLQQELGDLIFYLIDQVEEALNKGYLYEDEYDEIFEMPEAFDTLLAQYSNSLPFAEKIKFLKQLDDVIGESTYTVFDNFTGLMPDSFREEELPALKELLLQEYATLSIPLAEEYYELLRPHLSAPEKETILLHLKGEADVWLLELAELYRQQGREAEAVALIGTHLTSSRERYGQELVYQLYLDLLSAQGQVPAGVCREALENCASSSMLKKVAGICPEEKGAYEQLLEEKNPQALLEYLEKANRTADALGLLQRNNAIWDHHRWAFFKKHKEQFPEEAQAYFREVIDKNLPYTGNSHYNTVAEALRQLRQLNEPLTAKLVSDIRATYKRRSNLMNLLAEF